jgi:DnaJ-class molecular chaperone
MREKAAMTIPKKVLVFVVFILFLQGAGCALADQKTDPGTVLVDPEKTIQISIPSGWKEDRDLHDSAELQASNRKKELYVIVLSESKEDFQDMTLDRHSEITRATLVKSLTEPQTSAATTLKVNGHPAVQYEIRGFINNLSVIYLHTTVETEKNIHQILTWTLKSMYDKNKPALQKVTESFKEVKATVQ